ncbi:MAG: transposase, partial [Acidobacteria bacterium]|nr:transposase [Acidobacteriota bacterium]
FAQYGLPACIRSDNGKPFAGPGRALVSRLAMWWLRLGIRVERIALGRSDQNGSHERFHRDLKAQTTRPPAGTLAARQRRFDRFECEYNEERPHEALADAVPADRYRPSRRTLPRQLPPVLYPGHWEPRRVSAVGTVSWRARPLFLSVDLAGETVAFDEVDDGRWTLHFGTTPLARWFERERQWQGLRVDQLLPMSSDTSVPHV